VVCVGQKTRLKIEKSRLNFATLKSVRIIHTKNALSWPLRGQRGYVFPEMGIQKWRFMSENGLWVPYLDCYVHLWIVMSIYGLLCPFMDCHVHLWIVMSIYGMLHPYM
jgi:hypothetical protein